jgi:hypothetical protein
MKITAFTTAWNCRNSGVIDLIDYYLNVIKVDRFIYLDDHSNDGTIECIKGYYSMYDNSVGCIGDDPRLKIADVPYDCYTDQNAMKVANTLMQLDDSDVFIWVDSDEYIYHPTRSVRDIIEEERNAGKTHISIRLTNVFNITNTYNDSKTLLSQIDLYHQHNRELGSMKAPIIIKDSSKKIVFGGSNHYCIVDYKECIDDYDEVPNTLYLLHTCYLTDQFYIDRKVNAKKRLLSHNIYNSAVDDETGWWSKSLEDQRQSVINDKAFSKYSHEFFN